MDHALEGQLSDWPTELWGARAKIERAMEHVAAFNRAYEALPDSQPYRVVVQYESDIGCHVARINVSEEPLLHLNTIIGDIAHNLRSALDFIAWELAIKHVGKSRAKRRQSRISFPITSSERDFLGHSAMPFFSDDTKAVLERLQPYNRPDDPITEAFRQVSGISNRDKHRAHQPVLTVLDLSTLVFQPLILHFPDDWDDWAPGPEIEWRLKANETFEHGTEVARLRFGGPEPQTCQVDVTGQPSARVLFGQRGIGPNFLVVMASEVGFVFGKVRRLFQA